MILRAQGATLWRFGWVTILSLAFVYALLLLWVHVRESAVRSRSEALYAVFLKLQLGKTTKEDVEALRRQWADSLAQEVQCGKTDCEYTVGTAWSYSPWFLLTRLAHDHLPSSELRLRTDGDLLSSASFTAVVLVPKGYGTREERKRLSEPNYVPYSSGAYTLSGRASLVTLLPDVCCQAPEASELGYRVWGPSGCTNCLAIWVSALPSVEPAKRAQVFHIDFDCMTRWTMCTDKEDIMPTAGREKADDSAVRSGVPRNTDIEKRAYVD
jgi:hypothetical protein